jgi:hypothetical protein
MFFFTNSSSDQWLLIAALARVCYVRVGLWVLPFRVLKERVEKINSCATSISGQPVNQNLQVVLRVASCVRRASRYVPAATCLTQALATQILLGQRSQVSKLYIGVSKGQDGELKAHAWVESNGRIIIGQRKDLQHYTVLNRLEEMTR